MAIHRYTCHPPLGLTIGLLLVALIVVGTLIIARSISGGPDQSAPNRRGR